MACFHTSRTLDQSCRSPTFSILVSRATLTFRIWGSGSATPDHNWAILVLHWRSRLPATCVNPWSWVELVLVLPKSRSSPKGRVACRGLTTRQDLHTAQVRCAASCRADGAGRREQGAGRRTPEPGKMTRRVQGDGVWSRATQAQRRPTAKKPSRPAAALLHGEDAPPGLLRCRRRSPSGEATAPWIRGGAGMRPTGASFSAIRGGRWG